ncbi:hypothetical protein EV363DRAFT_48932 [Boletus edulis]|nr:hypothetical protein EV363DRAFT_48932 [Boletus edulis]
MTKRGVKDLPRRAKNNPSASLGIIFGVISVLLAITRAISLSRNYQPGGYIDFFDSDCTALALISLPASLMVVGSDRHQRNAYKHAFSMSAILTQLGMLAKWTMGFWISDRPRISETLCYRISLSSLWSITCALGWFTGHYQKLMQTRTCELNNFIALKMVIPHIPLQSF